MADATDPEPSDKRTNEWKAWKERQVAKVASLMPDPNVFGAAMAAGLTAFGLTANRLDHVKTAWHDHRLFIEWVVSGEDIVAYDKMVALENANARRRAEQVAKDAAAEKARRDAMREEFGAKQTSLAS
jgi:hypothetical protein